MLLLRVFPIAATFLFVLISFVQSNGSIVEQGVSSEERQVPTFGRPMRDEFLLNPQFVLLDHGAYGTYPKATQIGLHEFQARAEANPDLWMRREAKSELAKVREQLAELVKAEADDIVMVPNTTSGINAIFRSMIFKLGERILNFSTIYNSMNSIIQYIVDRSDGGVSAVTFNVTYPVSNDQIVSDLEAFLDSIHDPDKPIRVALIDHITSTPGVIIPIERIIPLLKARDITVVIDGAHAIGQIPIDLSQLAPDYYITNCHKWLYAARGCALLYVDKKHQATIHPASINSGYSQPANFQQEFFWTGTMDYSSYMSVTAALEFRRSIGGEASIMSYNNQLAREGGTFLAKEFGTQILQELDQTGSMVDVRLPIENPDDPRLTSDWWIDTLLYRYPEVYASPHKHGGQWWIRLSAQIYNDLDDFKTAGITFRKICDEINAGNFTEQTVTTEATTKNTEATSLGCLLKSSFISVFVVGLTFISGWSCNFTMK